MGEVSRCTEKCPEATPANQVVQGEARCGLASWANSPEGGRGARSTEAEAVGTCAREGRCLWAGPASCPLRELPVPSSQPPGLAPARELTHGVEFGFPSSLGNPSADARPWEAGPESPPSAQTPKKTQVRWTPRGTDTRVAVLSLDGAGGGTGMCTRESRPCHWLPDTPQGLWGVRWAARSASYGSSPPKTRLQAERVYRSDGTALLPRLRERLPLYHPLPRPTGRHTEAHGGSRKDRADTSLQPWAAAAAPRATGILLPEPLHLSACSCRWESSRE